MSTPTRRPALRAVGERSLDLLLLPFLLFLLLLSCPSFIVAQPGGPLASLQLWQVPGCSPNASLEDST